MGPHPTVKVVGVVMAMTTGVGAMGALASPADASPSIASTLDLSGPDRYTVQVGDTLATIAANAGTTVGALASLNHINDPNLIVVGQVLALSGQAPAPAARPRPTTVRSTAPARRTTYTVRSGDTLGSIAPRLGTTVAALVQANHLADANLIYVGDVLSVAGTPTGSAPATATPQRAPAPATRRTYTVQSGDTVGSVASQFGTTVAALVAANDLTNPNVIYVGQVLTLDGSAAPSAVSPTPPAAAPQHAVTLTTYVVQSGDTLGGVASQLNTTVTELLQANHLTDPNVIYVGQVLRLDAAEQPSNPVAAAPEPAQSSAPSDAASVAVGVALQQLGKPYQYGGAGPANYDCSGLVMYAYAAAGVTLIHYTVDQFNDTAPITEAQLQPGDLVFYNTGAGAQPGHVAMYIGGGNVIASNSPGTFVQTQPLSWDGTIMGFRRVE